jgi:5-methylthioadenosine/S-adenosylhomocysteine deaminase
MLKVDKIIHARWLIPLDKNDRFLENHSIIIDDGKIINISARNLAEKEFESDNITSLDHHIALPGFINCHTHSPMNLFRGVADDLPLKQWLTEHIWPAEQNIITPETTQLGSLLAIAEMIRGGTTCFNDHYFFPEATENAAISSGIRASLGLQVFNVETLWSKNETEALNKAEHILARRHNKHPNINWTIAPHAPYSVNDDALKHIKTLSEQYNIPVHMHIHETQQEIDSSLHEHACRPLARLQKFNLLNNKLLAVHMVHLNHEDLTTIEGSDIQVVHSPESNLKLGSGIAPIHQLHKKGFNIALGTDGAASNNDLDMIGEMRTASLIAKGSTQNPTALNAYEVLKMACINGARALGIDHLTGSLEIGKQADIIALDISDYWQQPIFNPVTHLVYTGNRMSITDSWVNGRQILKNQQLTTINVEELLLQLNEIRATTTPFVNSI